MSGSAVDDKFFFFGARGVAASKDFQPFSYPVRRIADDAVEKTTRSERAVGHIRDEAIQPAIQQVILLEIRFDIDSVFAPKRTSIKIRAHGDGAKMRAGNRKTAGADKRIVEDFAGPGKSEVRA